MTALFSLVFCFFVCFFSNATHLAVERYKMADAWQLYSQLSISKVQFCSSSGYLRRSIIQAAVVVILRGERRHSPC